MFFEQYFFNSFCLLSIFSSNYFSLFTSSVLNLHSFIHFLTNIRRRVFLLRIMKRNANSKKQSWNRKFWTHRMFYLFIYLFIFQCILFLYLKFRKIFIVLFFPHISGILQVLRNQFDTEEIQTFSYWKIKTKSLFQNQSRFYAS